LVVHVCGMITIRNFNSTSDGTPLVSYQVESYGPLDRDVIVDCDFKGDESNILLTFQEAKVAFLNLVQMSI
jgi:hypothetical protein